MQYRTFGKTGLEVPVIGMGTWKSLDVRGDREEADRARVVTSAFEAGTTLFDTSPMYGESERVLGKAVQPFRDRVLIADKVWTPDPTEGRRQFARALEWYGGTVDIYQVHNLVAWREHLPVLEELKAQGKVQAVGATHYAHSALGDLMRVMETGRLDMVQVPYNVGDRFIEREVLPLASELGLGVLVMEPLGSGSLVRRTPSRLDLAQLESAGITTWAQALLKWILADSRIHCVIPATRRRERAMENARAGDGPALTDEQREYIERMIS